MVQALGFSVDRQTEQSPDKITYAIAALATGANSKLSFAKLSFAFSCFKTNAKNSF